MTRPKLYHRDCKHCWKYIYQETDQDEGEQKDDVVTHNGAPMERQSGGPPCVWDECQKGHIDRPRVLSPRNLAVYRHYLECKATISFPDDPIVRRNARIIRHVEDEIERMEQLDFIGMAIAIKRG